jgi:hypothetical protein
MKKPDEVSPGGTVTVHHEPRERGRTQAAPSSAIGEIDAHFNAHFGEAESVFHELMSDTVHVDVHAIPPRPERNWWTLYTTGMSDVPMAVPPEAHAPKLAELLVSLPPGWRIDLIQTLPPSAEDARWAWPIQWLRKVARMPSDYATWLGARHTIPNGDPPEPFGPETKLAAWMLLPPVSVAEEGRAVKLADGRDVALLQLHALHADELALKLDKGSNALLDALVAAEVTEVLTLDRPSVARKKRFGFF